MAEDLSESVARHVGTHGAIMLKVGDECAVHLREFAQALIQAVRHSTPLNVAAYCIGGEMWSVGLVTVLYHCVKGLVGVNVEPVFPLHTCSEAWHRTCRGNCNMCRNALHSRMIEENSGVADAVQRFNEIYLELLEPRV